MFDQESEDRIIAIARSANLEPAALLALAEVESGGKVFALVAGRREPLIRFEGHYFDRRLSGAKREQARLAGLAAPAAGAVSNPRAQEARWKMLERACAIDRRAAYESVSWGLGQVMGAHWKWLGYASVDALAEDCRDGVGGQVGLMMRYIDKAGLAVALRNRDWKAFARGYNGPAFAANAYDIKMAEAYRRHTRRLAVRADTDRALPEANKVEKPAPPPATKPSPRPPFFSWLRRLFSGSSIADRG